MKTVTSLSGGKSSAYMAVHSPTDYYLFSVVLTEQAEVAPKDSGLLRECQKRIPGFIASRELDLTLINVLKLEQKLGKEIKWISATDSQFNPGMLQGDNWLPSPLTYDALIRYQKALPNRVQRWCTEQLKIYAIFWYTYLNIMEDPLDIVQMNIGFRWDEKHRVDDMLNRCDKIEFPNQCSVKASKSRNKHQWLKIDWRLPSFPLYEAKVDKLDVIKYWLSEGWTFPLVSNCDGCFHHSEEELHLQHSLYPERILPWWGQKEVERGATWKNGTSYEDILSYYQYSLFPVKEEGQSCFCTD